MSELEQKIEAELELMRAKLHKRGPHAKHFAQGPILTKLFGAGHALWRNGDAPTFK
jgi:hypothetical protein